MTPADLLAICDLLDDERGTGGQTKVAHLVGWHFSTLWRKLNGKSRITRSDELAVHQIFAALHSSPVTAPSRTNTYE